MPGWTEEECVKLAELWGLDVEGVRKGFATAREVRDLSITVVIFCWHILLISESMDHHDSEIMDDRSID